MEAEFLTQEPLVDSKLFSPVQLGPYKLDYRVVIKGAAFYEDTYERGDDGRWRISHTGYRRIYETMSSLDDQPSLKFIGNMWAPKPAS